MGRRLIFSLSRSILFPLCTNCQNCVRGPLKGSGVRWDPTSQGQDSKANCPAPSGIDLQISIWNLIKQA